MLKYTQFVSQAGQAFETIEVLKATLALKIRVSAVRFCPWPPFRILVPQAFQSFYHCVLTLNLQCVNLHTFSENETR